MPAGGREMRLPDTGSAGSASQSALDPEMSAQRKEASEMVSSSITTTTNTGEASSSSSSSRLPHPSLSSSSSSGSTSTPSTSASTSTDRHPLPHAQPRPLRLQLGSSSSASTATPTTTTTTTPTTPSGVLSASSPPPLPALPSSPPLPSSSSHFHQPSSGSCFQHQSQSTAYSSSSASSTSFQQPQYSSQSQSHSQPSSPRATSLHNPVLRRLFLDEPPGEASPTLPLNLGVKAGRDRDREVLRADRERERDRERGERDRERENRDRGHARVGSLGDGGAYREGGYTDTHHTMPATTATRRPLPTVPTPPPHAHTHASSRSQASSSSSLASAPIQGSSSIPASSPPPGFSSASTSTPAFSSAAPSKQKSSATPASSSGAGGSSKKSRRYTVANGLPSSDEESGDERGEGRGEGGVGGMKSRGNLGTRNKNKAMEYSSAGVETRPREGYEKRDGERGLGRRESDVGSGDTSGDENQGDEDDEDEEDEEDEEDARPKYSREDKGKGREVIVDGGGGRPLPRIPPGNMPMPAPIPHHIPHPMPLPSTSTSTNLGSSSGTGSTVHTTTITTITSTTSISAGTTSTVSAVSGPASGTGTTGTGTGASLSTTSTTSTAATWATGSSVHTGPIGIVPTASMIGPIGASGTNASASGSGSASYAGPSSSAAGPSGSSGMGMSYTGPGPSNNTNINAMLSHAPIAAPTPITPPAHATTKPRSKPPTPRSSASNLRSPQPISASATSPHSAGIAAPSPHSAGLLRSDGSMTTRVEGPTPLIDGIPPPLPTSRPPSRQAMQHRKTQEAKRRERERKEKEAFLAGLPATTSGLANPTQSLPAGPSSSTATASGSASASSGGIAGARNRSGSVGTALAGERQLHTSNSREALGLGGRPRPTTTLHHHPSGSHSRNPSLGKPGHGVGQQQVPLHLLNSATLAPLPSHLNPPASSSSATAASGSAPAQGQQRPLPVSGTGAGGPRANASRSRSRGPTVSIPVGVALPVQPLAVRGSSGRRERSADSWLERSPSTVGPPYASTFGRNMTLGYGGPPGVPVSPLRGVSRETERDGGAEGRDQPMRVSAPPTPSVPAYPYPHHTNVAALNPLFARGSPVSPNGSPSGSGSGSGSTSALGSGSSTSAKPSPVSPLVGTGSATSSPSTSSPLGGGAGLGGGVEGGAQRPKPQRPKLVTAFDLTTGGAPSPVVVGPQPNIQLQASSVAATTTTTTTASSNIGVPAASTVGARPMGARAPVVSPKSTTLANQSGGTASIAGALSSNAGAVMVQGGLGGARMPVRQRTLSASSVSGGKTARPVVHISTTPMAPSSSSSRNASGYSTDSGGKTLGSSMRERGNRRLGDRDRERDAYGAGGGHSGYGTSTPSSPTLVTPTALTGRRNLPIPGNQSQSGSGGGVTPTSGRPLGPSFTVGSIPIPSLPVGPSSGVSGVAVGMGDGKAKMRMVRPLPLPGAQQQQQQQSGIDRGTSPSPRLPFSPAKEFPGSPPPASQQQQQQHSSYPRDILGSRDALTREGARDQSRGAGSSSSAMSSPPSSAFGSPNMGGSMVGSVSSVTSASSGSVLGSDGGISRHQHLQYQQHQHQHPSQQGSWARHPHGQVQPLQPQRRHRSPTTGYHPHGAFNVRSGMAIPAPASPVTGPGQSAFFAQSPPRQPWAGNASQSQSTASGSGSNSNAGAPLRTKRRYDTYDGVVGERDGGLGGVGEEEGSVATHSASGHPSELDAVPFDDTNSSVLSYVDEPDSYLPNHPSAPAQHLDDDFGAQHHRQPDHASYADDRGFDREYDRSPSPIVYARPDSEAGGVSPMSGGSDPERRRVAAAAMGIFSDEDDVLDEFGPKRRGRYPHRRPVAASPHYAHRTTVDADEVMISPVEQISFARRTSVSPGESFRARSRRSSVGSSFDDPPVEPRSSSDDSAMMSVGATRRRRVKRELLRSYRYSYRLPPAVSTEGWGDGPGGMGSGRGGGSSSNVSLWNKDGEAGEEGRGRGKTRKKSKSKKRKTKRGDDLAPGGEEKKRGVLEAMSRAFDFDRDDREKEKDAKEDGDRDSQKSGEVLDVALFRRNLKVKARGGGVPPVTTNAHVQGVFPPASPIGASPMPHQFLSNQNSNPSLHHTHSNTSSNSGHYSAPAVQQESGGILDFVAFSGKKKSAKKVAMVVAVEQEIVRPGTADSGSTGRSVGNNATPSSSSQQSHSTSPMVWVSRANMTADPSDPTLVVDPADPKGKRPMKKRTASVPAVGFDSMAQGSSAQTQMRFQPQRRGKDPVTAEESFRDYNAEYEQARYQETTAYGSDAEVLSITAHRRMTEGARQGQRVRVDSEEVPPVPSLRNLKGKGGR